MSKRVPRTMPDWFALRSTGLFIISVIFTGCTMMPSGHVLPPEMAGLRIAAIEEWAKKERLNPNASQLTIYKNFITKPELIELSKRGFHLKIGELPRTPQQKVVQAANIMTVGEKAGQAIVFSHTFDKVIVSRYRFTWAKESSWELVSITEEETLTPDGYQLFHKRVPEVAMGQ